MFRVFAFVLFVGLCHAGVSTPPPPASPQVLCGDIPKNIFSCIGSPRLIQHHISAQCKDSFSECARMKCVFEVSKWMINDTVDKKKLSDYFDNFAKENPEWTVAVKHVKDACLTKDLLAQGVYKDCPAYDIMQCVLTGFIKQAQPSQWSSSQSCIPTRQYAAYCPVCPTDCFSSAIPIGSCNACVLLPRVA